MTSPVHFISGLPRSGSTLLAAILNQNPRFTASVTSPVASLWGSVIPKMSGATEFSAFFDDQKRRRILRAMFDGYHGEEAAKGVVFDTNRTWTGRASLLQELYAGSKIICCVREVGWIIDSIERMLRKNPLQTSRVFNFQPGSSVYGRVETLMNSENGLVGLPWSSLREAWFSENAGRILLVNYESLARDPAMIIRGLYEALEEPLFEHDFNHVIYEQSDYDADLGMPGLHKVHERVAFIDRPSVIPPDIFAKYADANFWLKPELNRRGVAIL